MSLFKITPDDVETFTLETYPRREFSSGSSLSSTPGIIGKLNVFARRSSIEKEVAPLSSFKSSLFNDQNLNGLLTLAQSATGSRVNQVQSYLNGVFDQQTSARKQHTLEISRFVPPPAFAKHTAAKLLTINNLMPYYRTTQPTQHFSTTNYNCLNFFTASSVNSDAVILYPNPAVSGSFPNGIYAPTGSWSIDFWINPKYTVDSPGDIFKAGTILHLSGVYAVSLVSGSSKDINGYTDAFRIQLQLSSSANVSPSLVGSANTDPLIVLTQDNSLKRNTWNHITIRNDPTYNFGTGSIFVNCTSSVNFVFTGSLSPSTLGGYPSTDGPSVLCLGNFYQGTNAGTSGLSRFFASDTATRDGVLQLNSTPGVSYPTSYSFQHPLNAEVHDIKVFNKFLTVDDIQRFQDQGPEPTESGLLFYVPPFFTQEAPLQTFLNGSGGVLATPFQTVTDSPKDIFNVSMSFGAGGLYMSLENFGRDFATGRYPRWLGLTGSVINNTTDVMSANDFLFATGSNRRRQYTVMPCDNGLFVPNFKFISKAGLSLTKHTNDLENTSLGLVSLREMVAFNKEKTFGLIDSGSILSSLYGSSVSSETGDITSGSWNNSLAILRQTKDNTSNQVVFFDISNLFYGSYIKPGTVTIRDTSMSGSSGKLSVTLKDDGYGNIFRADTSTKQAQWSSVGNVFYNEGLILVKAPQLFFFGKESWEIEFQGKQDIHILKFNLALPPLMATSSSNPNFQNLLPADSLANDTDSEETVLLSGLHLHDDNLNVIMRTNFAQTIVKRTSDKLRFVVKLDW